MPQVPAELPRRVAFLEKVFLKRRRGNESLRGVELFNLGLARELGALGYRVDLAAECSWAPVLSKALGEAPGVRVLAVRQWLHPVFAALGAASAFRREARRAGAPYGTFLVGNVGNGLLPAIRRLTACRVFRSMVLVAHREASARFLRGMARLPGHVVAVCEPIARAFREWPVKAAVHVDYGVMDAASFRPVAPGERAEDGVVRFGVLGALDNAWKGADMAVAAFEHLDPALRARCELHLMAYAEPPIFSEGSRIVAHRWAEAGTVPAFLRSLDALVVPSRDEEVMRETFSQATVQGMLTGLPVLHSALPVLVEKFDQGGGIRFDDVAGLTGAMERVARDPQLRARLGAEGRTTALARYVWNTARFAERYLS